MSAPQAPAGAPVDSGSGSKPPPRPASVGSNSATERSEVWRGRAVALLLLLLIALTAAYSAGWETDNRLSRWGGGAGDDANYARLEALFGGDEVVLLRAHLPAGDAAQPALSWASDLGARLATLPGLRATLNPLALPGAAQGGAMERFAAALTRPLVQSLDLLAADAQGQPERLDWLLAIAPEATPLERRALASEVRMLQSEAQTQGIEIWAAGHPLVAAALDLEALEVQRRFAPLLVLVAALAGLALWRNVGLVAAVLLPSVLASTGIQALLQALGQPSNMILVAVGPLVLVLMLASLSHSAAQYASQRQTGLAPREAQIAARRHILGGVMLAALTTAVGFLVFLTSPVPAVRTLGVAAGATMAVAVPLAYGLMGPMLVGLARHPPRARALKATRWRRLAIFGLRHPAWMALGSALVLVAGLLAPTQLPLGADSLSFFKPEHPVRREFLAIEADGGALSSLEVLLPGRFDPREIEKNRRFEAALAALPSVVSVFGPGTILADMDHLGLAGGPLGGLALQGALKRAGRSDEAGEWQRFSLRIADQGGGNLGQIADQTKAVAAEAAQELGWPTPAVTGSVALVVRLQRQLVHTLASSLAGTALVSLLAFLLVSRRPRILLAAAFSNALPVAGVLAATWLLGFALDAATVMVASVVLGLAVDNTFHLLRTGRPQHPAPTISRHPSGFATLRSGLRAFDQIGSAAWFSTLVLVAGFGVLTLAGFAPTARFGLLCSLGTALAFLADFLILPWIWLSHPRATPSPRVNPKSKAA